MTDPLSLLGNRVCNKVNREPTFLTAEQLWKALLHLATFGEWTIDPKTGELSASGGLLSIDRPITIYAFTNKEADGKGTNVYTNFYPLEEEYNKFFETWNRAKHPGSPPFTDYMETVNKDFYKNPLPAHRLENWKLVKAQKRRVEPGKFSREDVKVGTLPTAAPIRYRFWFAGPAGYQIGFNFYPEDKLYFCYYESKEDRKKKLTLPAEAKAPPEFMRIYEEVKGLPEVLCAVEGKGSTERKQETVKGLANSIEEKARHKLIPWRYYDPDTWRTNETKAGIRVNYIFGYKNGVPVMNPQFGPDNAGLRLVEIQALDRVNDLWRLKFVQTNRGFFGGSTITVYASGDDKVSLCGGGVPPA